MTWPDFPMKLAKFIHGKVLRPQFGLATLLASVTLISVPLAVHTSRGRAYRERLAAVEVLDRSYWGFVYVENKELPGTTLPLGIGKDVLDPDDVVLEIEIGGRSGAALSEEQISAILSFTTLKVLRIRGSTITVAQLGEIGKLRSLEHLALGQLEVGDEGVRCLGSLRSLRTLELYGTKVTDAGLRHLAPLQKLDALRLGDTQITDAGLVHLSALRSLRWLGLSGTRVTDAGISHLAALDSLRWLDLSKTKTSSAGLADLFLPQLEYLGLDGDDVDDAGLAHLARMPNLEELSLSQTRVTDAGLRMLRRFDSLERVVLRGCDLSDAGLVPVSKLMPLQEIFVEEAKSVTATGAAHLRRLRPIHVYWRDK